MKNLAWTLSLSLALFPSSTNVSVVRILSSELWSSSSVNISLTTFLGVLPLRFPPPSRRSPPSTNSTTFPVFFAFHSFHQLPQCSHPSSAATITFIIVLDIHHLPRRSCPSSASTIFPDVQPRHRRPPPSSD